MYLGAFPKVHPLRTQQNKSSHQYEQADVLINSVNYIQCELITYRSREDVMRAAVKEVWFADTLICEFNSLSRFISCKDRAHDWHWMRLHTHFYESHTHTPKGQNSVCASSEIMRSQLYSFFTLIRLISSLHSLQVIQERSSFIKSGV